MELIYRTKCKAVENGEVPRKGKVAELFEFYGKRKYSCWGYKDLMTEEAIEECRECPLYVWNVNEEFNKYIKEEKENGRERNDL